MKNNWSRISLIFLFIVALLGTLLRSIGFISIPFEYMNLVHAHSHVAFQGWVYTCILLLLPMTYLNDSQIRKGRYALQFILTVFVIAGILISFSLQGYGFYSILFSTLFQFLNYWFIFRFLKDVREKIAPQETDISLRFVKTGLWFGVLSTLLPIGIGVLSATGLSGTEAYRSSVYTFLHLQYNGWFLFVVLGLFFRFLVKINWGYGEKDINRFYYLLSIAVLPSITLSLLGMEFSNYVLPLAIISSVLLFAALVFFIRGLPKNFFTSHLQMNFWLKTYLLGFVLSFVLKTTLQFLSVLPALQPYAFHNKFIIVAYLHLSLIGSISFFLLALFLDRQWIPVNRLFQMSSILFISGFATTEILLTLVGFGLFYSQSGLAVGSAAMALGIFLMVVNRKSQIDTYGRI